MRSPNLTRSLLFLVALISIAATVLIRWPARQAAALDRRSKAETINAAVQPVAFTFTVNTSTDLPDSNIGDNHCDTDGNLVNGDQCSLRAAMQEGNAANSGYTINFNLAANTTITVNSALPGFLGNVSIVGPGSSSLTIQRSSAAGTPNFGIFGFAPISGNFNNSLSGLTLVNGNSTSNSFPNDSGGAIMNFSSSTTTLTDVVLRDSTATKGGGLYNGGTIVATNLSVIGNSATSGGGIYNEGTLTLTNTTISGNATSTNVISGNEGGGIYNLGTLTLDTSAVSANSASSGGGIFNFSYPIGSRTVTITNSTISGNTAQANGGGIYNYANCPCSGSSTATATINLTNSTVSSNNSAFGGGIANASEGSHSTAILNIDSSTVYGNNVSSASGAFGGGIANHQFGNTNPIAIRNTIVAGNLRDATTTNDILGPLDASSTFNLIGDGTGMSGVTNGSNGNQVGTSGAPINPLLAPLADNGGPTKTHALLVGSPAIDAGNSSQTTDQRGQSRPIDDPNVTNAGGGNATDIGAFETNTFQVNTPVDGDDGACTAVGTGNGCTLREAINAANAATFAEVSFASALTSSGPATISLSTALPSVSSNVIIEGPGANLLTVMRSSAPGTPNFRIFAIGSAKVVTISGLTIANGNQGGIFNDAGTLTVEKCVVTGHSGGAAIKNSNVNGGRTTINYSTITNNTAGGIDNSVNTGSAAPPAALTINNSTISGNSSSGLFAGIGNAVGAGGTATMTINNSTISGNTTSNNTGVGGIFNFVTLGGTATLAVNNSTIYGNNFNGASGTGGVYQHVDCGPNPGPGCVSTIKLRNTIVAGNLLSGSTPSDVSGAVDSSSSFNLIGTGGSGGLSNGTNNNQVGVSNPGLGPLANNGGATQTHALLLGSPAIDAGDNCVVNNSCSPALASALISDQRGSGFNRSADGNGDGTARVDIGAYEVQSILVTNLNDSGAGSLRQAITDANANPDTSAINFQSGLTGTITLLSALPDLSTSMSINGPGANLLTISGNNASRVFNIQSGTVTISGVTIANGNLTGSGTGGGVRNAGTLSLTNVTVSSNNVSGGSSSGGGISNIGILTLTSSIVSGNNVGFEGGGIYNGGLLTMINSSVSANAAFLGGGIYNDFSAGVSATLINSTVSGNTGVGGGIYNLRTLNVTNSTVSGNLSAGHGGGIYNANGVIRLTNVTITNNRSDSDNSGAEQGGGIYNSSTSPVLQNTIAAGNFRGTGTTRDDIWGLMSPGSSFNLIGDGTNMTGISNNDSNHNQVGSSGSPITALLGSLAANGGPTMTHALLPGSPAINTGSNANLPLDTFDLDGDTVTNETLPVDQRGVGFARVSNTTVDIGAFESRGFTIATTNGSGQTATITTAFAAPLVATVSSASGEPVAGGSVTFTASPSGASGTFTGGVTSVAVTTNSSGVATSPTFTANGTAGSYNVTASANGITGSPTSFSLTNAQAPTSTGVASSVNPSDFGESVTLTATVSSTAGTPSGTVQFMDGAANLGSPVNCAAGVGNTCTSLIQTSALTAGTHTITANYSDPNANFTSSSGTLSGGQVVKPQPSLSINDVSMTEGDSGTKNFVFNVTLSAASHLQVKVDFATADGTATIADSDYQAKSDTLTFNSGDTTKTITVLVNGDQKFEPNETFFVNLTNSVNATISDSQGQGTIVNDDAQGGIISFSASEYTVFEADGSVTITVNRTGDTTAAATVDYATDDTGAPAACGDFNGLASSKCDFTTALGTLTFAPNETQKTFSVLVNRDSYTSEIPFDAFSVKLSNLTGGAVFGTNSTAAVKIMESGSPGPNAIDDSAFFVRQHYHDFLNREPDGSGLQFWTNEIESCGADANCREVKRINVSGAFFLSIEFQQTGYLVERLYKTAYGDAPGNSTFPTPHPLQVPIVRFNEFLADTQEIGRGVVVGQPNWEQQLESNKVAFINLFVQRARFTTALGAMGNSQFVDTLNVNAGNPLSTDERNQLVARLDKSEKTRAEVLRAIAEHPNLMSAEFNRAFVLMQFFGYLRRNPDDPQDHDHTGYDFWLTKLNQFGGNFQNAEMVKAFITSDEYRHRFGP